MYTASNALRTTTNEDGAIVLDLQQGRIFRLNTVASLVLKKLQEGRVVTEIVREIGQEFSTPCNIVEQDVAELLSRLEKHGLIESHRKG